MNLLEETTEAIDAFGQTPEGIVYIGSADKEYACTWDEYKELADVEYDEGSGSTNVADDLLIVFNDGAVMWRGEYDGSEWWNYHPQFVMPTSQPAPILRLVKPEDSYEHTVHEISAAVAAGKYGKK